MNSETWIIYIDGSSEKKETRVRVVLKSPIGDELEQSINLGFLASNNEVKYKAVIHKAKNGPLTTGKEGWCS